MEIEFITFDVSIVMFELIETSAVNTAWYLWIANVKTYI